jgi:hypothetical protein
VSSVDHMTVGKTVQNNLSFSVQCFPSFPNVVLFPFL